MNRRLEEVPRNSPIARALPSYPEGLIFEGLDPVSEQDFEVAWSKEIEQRLTEIDAGNVELVPWEEVREELLANRIGFTDRTNVVRSSPKGL